MPRRILLGLRGPRLGLLGALLLSACATSPPARVERARPSPASAASPVVSVAQDLLGTPYRYGGASPAGFDCSGFVQYVYARTGVNLPRSAADQYAAVRRVSVSDLRAGDILFFQVSRRKVSHVGIYVDRGRFIHAPSSGKRVDYASIRDGYWSSRLVGAGRVL